MPKRPPIHPWPLAIIVFFALAITFVLSFIAFSLRNRVDMVAPNYYARELTMQSEIDTDERTRRAPVQVRLRRDAARELLVLEWVGPEAAPSISGTLEFYRPADASLDFQIPFALSPGATVELSSAELRRGFWRVGVRWTLDGEPFFLREEITL